MLATQTDVFPTTLAASTVLSIREANTYIRILWFKNLTGTDLNITIESSADGGTTWTVLVPAFVLTAAPAAGSVQAKQAISANILRVRASGVTDDQGLMISYTRQFLDATRVWQAPVV